MTSSLPPTMKVVHQPDPLSVNLVLEDGPLPKLTHSDDCLIRIYTASPCLGELHWEEWFPALFEPGRERVPTTEAAGVVVQAPPQEGVADADKFKAGDEVFFRLQPGMAGNLREYSIARVSHLAHKPKNVDWVTAGATPLSALTAWQGVFDQSVLDPEGLFGNVHAREKNSKLRVLITGASGVVGGWAVQLAALAGAGGVVAYASGQSADYVKSLGASEVVDYKKTTLAEWAAEDPENKLVDAVLDCVGGQTLASCWHAVKEGGVLLSVAEDPNDKKPESVQKTMAVAKWFLVEAKGSQLERIAKLMGEGKCVTKVDSAVEFQDFNTAFQKVEQKKATGKVVIKVAKL